MLLLIRLDQWKGRSVLQYVINCVMMIVCMYTKEFFIMKKYRTLAYIVESL